MLHKQSSYAQPKLDLQLMALFIDGEGKATETPLALSYINEPIFVQPGMTPPSEIGTISQEFKEAPGAMGCTGESKEVSNYCKNSFRYGYIVSGKSLPQLHKVYAEK